MHKTDSNTDEIKRFMEGERAFLKSVQAEIEPFIACIREMPAESPRLMMFRQACIDYFDRHKHYGKLSRHVAKDILRMTGTAKDKLQWILWYLCVLEGINHTVVNVLIILINATETKIETGNLGSNYFTKQIVNARSLDDLEKSFFPLSGKLSFLRANGLKEVASIIDTEFRNDVAHFNFDIQDGEIVIGDKKIMPLIAENVHKLFGLLFAVSEYLKKLAREKEFF